MGIEETYDPVRLAGSNSIIAYAYDFKIFEKTDIKVSIVDQATNVVTSILSYPGDFSVIIDPSIEGGSTTPLVEVGSTNDIIMELDIPILQPTNIPNVGGVREKQLENPYDRNIMISQLLSKLIEFSIKVSTEDFTNIPGFDATLPTPEINKALIWKDDLTGLKNSLSELNDLDASLGAADASAAAALVSETNAATSETNAAASAASVNIDLNDVKYTVYNVAQAIVSSGSLFEGVDSGKVFTFTSNRTFDIAGTAGTLGSLNTGSEAPSTWVYLIALGDTTDASAPHVIGVTEANYVSFTTADLIGDYSVYNDYKRIGAVYNDSSSDLNLGEYHDQWFYRDGVIVVHNQSSATFADTDMSRDFPPINNREVEILIKTPTSGVWYYRIKGAVNGVEVRGLPEAAVHVKTLVNSDGVIEGKTSAGNLQFFGLAYKDDLSKEGQ